MTARQLGRLASRTVRVNGRALHYRLGVEPLPPDPPVVVLVHGTQHGGVRPAEAYSALCEAGPFAGVSRSAFATLLRNLGGADLITQASDGTLLLGRTGERIVNHYSFYAAFATPEEYTLYSEGRLLGTLPIDQPLTEGTLLIFAGRRWRVLSVDESRKVVDLARAKGGRPPRFTGAHAPIHDRVRREMLDVYRGKDMPPFLDPTARTLLAEARQYFTRYRLDECPALEWGADTLLFLWKGDRVMGTAAVALAARGLEVSADGLALSVSGTSPDNLRKHLERMLAGGVPDATALAASVVNKESEKYDWVLKGPLLDAAYAARSLDPPGAWRSLRGVLDHLTTGRGETGPSTNPDHSRWT